MLSYAEICADNKHFYGMLEQCALAIKAAEELRLTDEANVLCEQYNAITTLININLDKLEAYWVENGAMYINNVDETEMFASKKDAIIINTFLENPGMKIETIAATCSVHKSTAARIIDNWYKRTKGGIYAVAKK